MKSTERSLPSCPRCGSAKTHLAHIDRISYLHWRDRKNPRWHAWCNDCDWSNHA